MGYDANKKVASKRRSAAQRLAAVAALLLLAGAFVVAVSFSRPPSSGAAAPGGAGTARGATARRVRTAQTNDASRASQTTSDRTRAPGKARARESSGASRASEEAAAAAARAALEDRVRALKKTGVIMEADAESRRLTAQLQDATRELLALRYGDIGDRNYRVRLDLEFQPTIPDFAEKGKEGSLLVELAPASLLPCSVYNFLEIARTWKKGAFHRNADHVLQAIARSDVTRPMPFQEYRREYPHRRGTLGYAGRPSGPEFYVSIQDNTEAHGPGSQQSHNKYEADCIIGTVIEGMDDGTVDRIHTMPGREFLGDKKKWVLIRRMHILVPGEGPGAERYIELSQSPLVIPED